jgi:cation transport ATPase
VILIGDRLQDVANALDLGKASYRTLTGNVVIAVIFNVLGMGLAALGLVTPLLAIVFMIVSIFAILFNTLRVRFMTLEAGSLEAEGDGVAHAEYRVPEMVCEGCAGKITEAFQPMPGVRSVTPRVAQKKVSITYEPAVVSRDRLKATFGELGFTGIEV